MPKQGMREFCGRMNKPSVGTFSLYLRIINFQVIVHHYIKVCFAFYSGLTRLSEYFLILIIQGKNNLRWYLLVTEFLFLIIYDLWRPADIHTLSLLSCIGYLRCFHKQDGDPPSSGILAALLWVPMISWEEKVGNSVFTGQKATEASIIVLMS